ncbi:hypothetical protein LY78DRAFT_708407 [Colletotrichum sublineola]|nr:hypothetical protein LY78DRAFT_708407 [Colletotrichum sublineola]
MAAPITQQQFDQAKDAAAAASVRKRRRRALTGGAGNNCFTCPNRNVKCDHKRPYYSQYLKISIKGKLRGLSLPIANAPLVARVDIDAMSQRSLRKEARFSSEHITSTPMTPFTPNYNILSISYHERTLSMTTGRSSPVSYMNEEPNYWGPGAHPSPIPISRALSSSLNSVSDANYLSPMNHSYSSDDIPLLHSPNVMCNSYNTHGSQMPESPISAILINQRGAPTPCPSLMYVPPEHSLRLASHMANFEGPLSQKLVWECDTLSEMTYLALL